MDERLQKWRMILGQQADPEQSFPLTTGQLAIDANLEALYDSDRQGGLGSSQPNINRWLGDIRKYFPSSVVQILQKDALDKLGIERMLLEPELLDALEPNANLAATLLHFKQLIPAQTKETARQVIQKIADQIQKRLQKPLQQAVRGALSRAERKHNPSYQDINWHHTIRKNLKHYLPKYKTIVPVHTIGYGRRRKALKHIVLVVDQSASMSTSVVYAGIAGATIASLPALRTSFLFFDTSVVDMTEHLDDPVELLFGAQLGGGTDITKALTHAQTLVEQPLETTILLVTDLFEGGNLSTLLNRTQELKDTGVNIICLLALNDEGAPSYNKELAQHYRNLDIPAFACTPDQFPELIGAALERQDIRQWAQRAQIHLKN